MNDHDRLVEIHRMVEELWKDVQGNGLPGMMTRLAKVETKLDERTSPKSSVWGGGAGAAVASVLFVIGKVTGWV